MNAAQKESLAAKVRFLRQPEAYSPRPRSVEARETHMSWVFLTEDRVYKLKKPARLRFLDFSTIEKRRFFCEEELRLNRRLAPETYLRTVPICRRADGRFLLGGGGRVADWLVEMVRLPQSDMLDQRLALGAVTETEITEVGRKLVAFYRAAGGCPEDARSSVSRYAREQAVNRSILLRRPFAIGDMARKILDRTDRLLAEVSTEIDERADRGIICEGHGDLRPEHVCLCHPLQIIDCLEFSRPMRTIDPYDEVNYLGIECEMLGGRWLRKQLVELLTVDFGQRPTDRLLSFYGAYRCLLRARLSIAHLLEKPVRKPEKWRPLTIAYLRQAERELVSFQNPEAP